MRYNLIILLFLLASVSIFSSCEDDLDGDGVVDKMDKCDDTPLEVKVDKKGCPIMPPEIGKVHFYIETSASMGGYFNKDAEYKTIISDLTSKIDKNINPIDIWFTAETTSKYANSVNQFSSDIATTKIADQKSSQLHKIIANIMSKSKPNDIVILVSDCILSFPDADIKKNPEINRNEAPNALKNYIFSTFADLKKKDIATSIYAFKSKFYGTYYDYQNGKHTLSGTSRPFYIWVMGSKELLPQFNARLAEISTFKPENSLHFGLTDQAISSYDIISQIDRKGTWMKSGNEITDIEIKSGAPVQFTVALNLANLPAYARDVKYLNANLKADPMGCEVKYLVKNKSEVDRSKLKSKPQIEAFESATHVIVFTIKSMNLSDAKIHTYLPLNYDTWHLDWSTMNDKNIQSLGRKTFAFEYLINGVTEAYQTKNKFYIDFTVNLKK